MLACERRRRHQGSCCLAKHGACSMLLHMLLTESTYRCDAVSAPVQMMLSLCFSLLSKRCAASGASWYGLAPTPQGSEAERNDRHRIGLEIVRSVHRGVVFFGHLSEDELLREQFSTSNR